MWYSSYRGAFRGFAQAISYGAWYRLTRVSIENEDRTEWDLLLYLMWMLE